MPIEDVFLPSGDFENPLLKEQGYHELTPSLGSSFKAGLGLGEQDAPYKFIQDLETYEGNSGRKLTVDQANKEYGIPGFLNFDRDIGEDAARVIRERKYKELAFEDRINRATTGGVAVSYLGQFAGQMYDPINLVASFIPVTKIPGVSSLLTGLRNSPFLTRAAVGGIEGAAGQLAIEPIYSYGDYVGFEEHTVADVMKNVAFGSVFGAGAHVSFGYSADAGKYMWEGIRGQLAGKQLSTHQDAVTAAINQMIEGQVVNVDPIIRTDPTFLHQEQVRSEIEYVSSTGNYSGPAGYSAMQTPPTSFGLEGTRVGAPGGQVIANNIPVGGKSFEVLDLDGFTSKPISIGGSNKAMMVEGPTGRMYVKPLEANRAKSEVLANNLYQLFGDELIIPANLVRINGELGVSTPYSAHEQLTVQDLLDTYGMKHEDATLDDLEQIRQMLVNSVIDMFLGNRDAFAAGNIIKTDSGYRKIDQGGSMFYRAQGEQKEFGSDVTELMTMTTKEIAPDAGRFLEENLTRDLVEEGVEKILRVTPQQIIDQVLAANLSPELEKKTISALLSRQNFLRTKFPEVTKRVSKERGDLLQVADARSAYQLIISNSRHFKNKLDKRSDSFEIRQSIDEYQQGSVAINQYLRTGSTYAELDFVKAVVKDMDIAAELGKLEQDAILYRWMPANLFHPNQDLGYISTSVFAEKSPFHIDMDNEKNLMVVLHTPKGTKGVWPDVANVHKAQDGNHKLNSSFTTPEAGEYEFVLARGTKYEVMGEAVERVTKIGNKFKEIHVRVLPEKPLQQMRPMTFEEIKAGATEYFRQPPAAAEVTQFLPPEAVTFNSLVKDMTYIGNKFENAELQQMINDLQVELKNVLTPEEIKAIMEPVNTLVKETDDYISGMNQAFICWKNA
jgi:hypothetical protein